MFKLFTSFLLSLETKLFFSTSEKLKLDGFGKIYYDLKQSTFSFVLATCLFQTAAASIFWCSGPEIIVPFIFYEEQEKMIEDLD